ncbi:hypothetical protein B296_00031084 [Ensete ventricosum]|uniref:Uncharacterized protein n=1 Tax=Ensete ventricosum TaxID=4639 RepID=A0A426Z032_ENSVE|nr:hypothetical protein B296_00031084 [Ensete ventricosum]
MLLFLTHTATVAASQFKQRLLSLLISSLPPTGRQLSCLRLLTSSYNHRRTKEKRMTEEEAKVEEPAVAASMEGKVIASGESNLAIDAASKLCYVYPFAGKQSDAVSLNLGMGVGLVFLLSRSATEIDKMEQLRAQMEILLKDIKDEMHNKDVSSHLAESNNVASSASNSYMEPEAETRSKCASSTRNTACLSMHQMEAEMEVELKRLQCAVGRKLSSLPPHRMVMWIEMCGIRGMFALLAH